MARQPCPACGLPMIELAGTIGAVCGGCSNKPDWCECKPRGTGETDGKPGPRVIRLADVEPEHVDWLWPGYLPRGKVVTLDGDPGVGKSTVAVDVAARISTGSPMPDGAAPVKGAVLILSAEDGLADTIRPRLDAAGGDPAQVVTITEMPYVGEDGQVITRPVVLPGDLPAIEEVVTRHGVALIIVDVLSAYLSGTVDAHRDQDVRRALHPLAIMADRTGCSVLVLRHLSKQAGQKAIYRGGGSIAITGAARAAFMVGADPEDDSSRTRVLAPVKCNLSAMPPSLAYQLVPDELRGCARVDWLGQTSRTAAALLAERGTDEERTERDEAVEWLTAYLTDPERGGEGKAGEIIKAATKDGIAERTLQRARRRAGVTTAKSGLRGGWLWRLDLSEGDTKAPKITGPKSLAPSASSGAFGEPDEAAGFGATWPEGSLGAEANEGEEPNT